MLGLQPERDLFASSSSWEHGSPEGRKAPSFGGSSVLDPQLLIMAGSPRTEHCFSGLGFLPEHCASPDSSLAFSNFPEYVSLLSLSVRSVHQMQRDTAPMKALQSPY